MTFSYGKGDQGVLPAGGHRHDDLPVNDLLPYGKGDQVSYLQVAPPENDLLIWEKRPGVLPAGGH